MEQDPFGPDVIEPSKEAGYFFKSEDMTWSALRKSLQAYQIKKKKGYRPSYERTMIDSLFDLKYTFGISVPKISRFTKSRNDTHTLTKEAIASTMSNYYKRDNKRYGYFKKYKNKDLVINRIRTDSGVFAPGGKGEAAFNDDDLCLDGVEEGSLTFDLINSRIAHNAIVYEIVELKSRLEILEKQRSKSIVLVSDIDNYIRTVEKDYLDIRLKINKGKTW